MGLPSTDYYELLQISPSADAETIHRVYRFLAARLHPDNRETGHADTFHLLKEAYDVLSDPRRRMEYDSARASAPREPLSTTIDFMDNMEGETNRRLAVLALLYYKRRSTPIYPEVALAEVEDRMGFPRDYLDFTLWYLQKKGYIAKADNAQYTLTVEGVDYVEAARTKIPMLHKLLTSGSGLLVEDLAPAQRVETGAESADDEGAKPRPAYAPGPIILPASMDAANERRQGKPDRRTGASDLRAKKVERRSNLRDRRLTPVTGPAPKEPLLARGDS